MKCWVFGILFVLIAGLVSLLIAGWIFVSLEWTDAEDHCEDLSGLDPSGNLGIVCKSTPTADQICESARKALHTAVAERRPYLAQALTLGASTTIARIESEIDPFETRESELCLFTPTPSMTATSTPTATFTATAMPTPTATSSPTTTPTATPTTTALETPMTSYPMYTPMPPTKPMFPEYDSPTVIPPYPTPQPTWAPSPVAPVVAPTPTITPTPSPVTIPVVIDIQEPQQPSIENDPNYWVILAGISAVLAQIAVILGVIYRIKHNKEP